MTQPTGAAADAALTGVTIASNDLTRHRAIYEAITGQSPINGLDPVLLAFAIDDATITLRPSTDSTPGYGGIANITISVGDLDAAERRLSAANAPTRINDEGIDLESHWIGVELHLRRPAPASGTDTWPR